MARPQKGTLDAWLTTFASWAAADREGALLQAQDVHNWTSKAEKRLLKSITDPETNGDQPALPLERAQ